MDAALADPATRRSFERLLPGARILGVRVPPMRTLAKEVRRRPGLDLDRACDLMDRLCGSGLREEVLVGTFVLCAFGKHVATVPWTKVRLWLPAIDNWETCDQLAVGVAAPERLRARMPARVVREAAMKLSATHRAQLRE